ncbi:TPA: hypothetical protein ACHOUR_000356 [Escherichia coli]
MKWRLEIWYRDVDDEPEFKAVLDTNANAHLVAAEMISCNKAVKYEITPQPEHGERLMYKVDVRFDPDGWEGWGLYDAHDDAKETGIKTVRFYGRAREYRVIPVIVKDNEVIEMARYEIDNMSVFKENMSNSIDQSCPGEIHAHGFPVDDPNAKREYENAAKDFCIDNLGAYK